MRFMGRLIQEEHLETLAMTGKSRERGLEEAKEKKMSGLVRKFGKLLEKRELKDPGMKHLVSVIETQ